MCPHRSFFSSYQTIDSCVVLMGNNVSCKTKVGHVPKLRKKKNSFRVLDSGGHMSEKELKIFIIRKSLLDLKYLNLNLCEHYFFGSNVD